MSPTFARTSEPGGSSRWSALGGVGKTRLAVEAALGVTADWDDGVWLVDLASLDDA